MFIRRNLAYKSDQIKSGSESQASVEQSFGLWVDAPGVHRIVDAF